MRYVDHDPTAARVAALRCRDAAHEYVRIAGVVAIETAHVAWWGPSRDRVLGEVEVLATDLRREATALLVTADRLEESARAAERQEAELRAGAAAAAAAAVCPPASTGATVRQGSGRDTTRPPSRSPTTRSSGASTGVR